MIDHYILNPDGTTQLVGLTTWGNWFNGPERFLARYERDGWWVSTVFIGIDHRLGSKGPPLLFETAVFDGEEVTEMHRYSTKDDALIGHERCVRDINRKLDRACEIVTDQLAKGGT